MSVTQIQTYVQPDQIWSEGIQFVLSLFKPVLGVHFEISSTVPSNGLVIGSEHLESPAIHYEYWQKLSKHDYKGCHDLFCTMEDHYFFEKIFHLINCVQEYSLEGSDTFGRFTYSQSWQFQQNNITQNIVLQLMQAFLEKYQSGIATTIQATRIFLSHDIDTIHGEFLQNGKYYLRTFQIHKLKTVILNYLLNRPGWANMDLINQLHSDYGVKHAYFWLVEKGKKNNIVNADYSNEELARYSRRCASNGLHKSSAETDYATEMKQLPFPCAANRNHFLRYSLPHHWDQLEKSELKMDASMGFAEHYGFRNSYGYPFRPFNTVTHKCYSHISVPLHVMDATFRNYLHLPLEETAETIIQFIEQNRRGCILSLLWHNTFFTDGKYAGYGEQYIKILGYMNDNGLETLDINDLLKIETN